LLFKTSLEGALHKIVESMGEFSFDLFVLSGAGLFIKKMAFASPDL